MKITAKVPCVTGRKYHSWKKSSKILNESHICGYCGYDVLEQRYRDDSYQVLK